METKKSDIIDNRHIINPHVDGVTGKTQMEVNEELSSKFITLNPEHPLFQKLSKDVEFLNKGILVINNDSEDPSIYIKDTEGNIVKISGNGSMTVNNAEEAINEASINNIGQLVYIQENSSYGGENYSFGPYIVIGDKTIIKLSTSTPSGDVSGDVVKLQSEVKELKEKSHTHSNKDILDTITNKDITKWNNSEQNSKEYANETFATKDSFNKLNRIIGSENDFTGIFGKIKEVQDNLDNISIPNVPVQDVKVNGDSVLDKEGVANITFTIPEIDLPDFNAFEKVVDANVVRERMDVAEGAIESLQRKDIELITAIDDKVAKEDGKSLVTDDEIAKLATVAEGAQVNIIEVVKVNGEELQIEEDKSVNISFVQKLNGGSGINITKDNFINVKLSKDEKYLTIDENGALITHDINSTTIVNNSDELLEIAERISTKEGTLVYLNETDERYLKGLYYINIYG